MGNEIKVIEKRNIESDHGMTGCEAIINHPKHGRLLIMDRFGGIGSLAGGAVRWRHGLIIKIKDTDTINSLKSAVWNESVSHYEAVINGYDDERPVLEWEGFMIERVAESAGL